MSRLKRYFSEGNVYFITVVTYERNPILIDSARILLNAVEKMRNKYRAIINYHVILPDHFHLIIQPTGNDLNRFVHDLKLSFGASFRKENELQSGRIWQARYWDHIVRNEDDLNNHVDYIHYNPVKHKLVPSPFDWKYSSIHSFEGCYQDDWGVIDVVEFEGDYGE